MNLQFITAATPKIGQGHVYRTIALAKEMEKRGHNYTIAATPDTVGGEIVWANVPSAHGLLSYSEIDCYILDIPGPHHYIPYVWKTIYLDWTGDEQYDGAAIELCALKICQGIPFGKPNADNEKAGFEYAILWPDVVEHRGQERKEQVFFYSSQHNELTDRVLKLLESTGIKVVQPQPGTARSTELLASSAVAVTFGGMTCLEACCLGIPQVAIITGPKHELQINHLASREALWGLADHSLEMLYTLISFLLNSWKNKPITYEKMSNMAMEVIDGKGVYRVADAIESLV